MKILLTAGALVISAFTAVSGAMAYSPQSSNSSAIATQPNILITAPLMTDRLAAAGSQERIKVADRRGRRHGRHRHRHRNNVAKGVALGVFGAIVAGALSEQARADEERRCAKLDRRCERGSDNACDEFYATCE